MALDTTWFGIAAKVADGESADGYNGHYGDHRIAIAGFCGGYTAGHGGTFATPWGQVR